MGLYMSPQITVRISEDLAVKLDELVRSGDFESRAAAVRAGLEAIARIDERHSIDRSILEGIDATRTRRRPPGGMCSQLRQPSSGSQDVSGQP